jgi:hypothetical protein
MPRSSHDAENQSMRCDVGMQLSTPRKVARLCYSWPLSPAQVMHIFAFSCQTRYRIASHLYPCTRPAPSINPAPSPKHTTWPPACRACLSIASNIEHRTSNIEHRLDLTCLAHDPTHKQLRVCSPARLFGGSVWVGFINGMVWPGRLASFVEERRNQTTTTTTVTTTTTTTTTTSTSASQTTTSTTHLHTIVSSFLPLNHPLSKVVCFFEPS